MPESERFAVVLDRENVVGFQERDLPCTSMLSPTAGSIPAQSWSLSNASNATKNTKMSKQLEKMFRSVD